MTFAPGEEERRCPVCLALVGPRGHCPECAATEFDEATHTYRIDGRAVPSVTQVLRDLLPAWRASEWHLQRGRAVHACCAMIARGREFRHDPQIDGQVKAARLWFAHTKPIVRAVECRGAATRYQFAGTADMVAEIQGKLAIVDWKATLTPAVPYQLGAYALLYREVMGSVAPRYGYGVELHEDGTYRMSERYDLRVYGQRFLALLTAFNVRRECGISEEVSGE